MGCSDEMEPSQSGLKVEGATLVPVMTDKSPAHMHSFMIHCNCLEGCINTLSCTCRKHGLECTTSVCEHCQDGNCDMTNDPVIIYDDDVWKVLDETLWRIQAYPFVNRGWGATKGLGVQVPYGIRGDPASLVTISYERLILKTWVKVKLTEFEFHM